MSRISRHPFGGVVDGGGDFGDFAGLAVFALFAAGLVADFALLVGVFGVGGASFPLSVEASSPLLFLRVGDADVWLSAFVSFAPKAGDVPASPLLRVDRKADKAAADDDLSACPILGTKTKENI